MGNTKRQLKINKIFRKGVSRFHKEQQREDEDLQDQIQQLQNTLREKKNELFQILRNNNRCSQDFLPKKTKQERLIVRPQKIILTSDIESLKKKIDVMSMLTGVEVQSYVEDEHCCVIYHMQHNAPHEVKHGLRIDMTADGNKEPKLCMPPGFNFNAVTEDFDNVKSQKCLNNIRRALVAYYERLEQYDALKKLLTIEAQLFTVLDGSHMEISFLAQNALQGDDELIEVVMRLDYRLYDIRPKNYSFKETDLLEGVADVLKQQCLLFKRIPLHKAFKETFIDGVGPYKLIKQFSERPTKKSRREHKSRRPQNINNDDTYRPEECIDSSDDDNEDKCD